MRFAICNEIYHQAGWSLEQAFRHAADTGYDAIEIAPFTLARYVTEIDKARRQWLRKLAKEHGLAISGIHWVLAQTEGLHLTHPDRGVRERTARYFIELVRFCEDIEGKFIVLGSPKQRRIEDGADFTEAARRARAVLDPAVKLAEQVGVTICIEPLGPQETNFINSVHEAVQFILTEPSKALRIMLDVKAMASEGRPIPEIIRSAWPHFVYFHANDANLKGPGFGEIDFHPIFRTLIELGYDGYVSVEVFRFDEGPEEIAIRSLRYMMDVLEEVRRSSVC